jgi:hypothetical protein
MWWPEEDKRTTWRWMAAMTSRAKIHGTMPKTLSVAGGAQRGGIPAARAHRRGGDPLCHGPLVVGGGEAPVGRLRRQPHEYAPRSKRKTSISTACLHHVLRAMRCYPTPASSCAVHPPRPGRGRVCRAGADPSPSFPRGLGFYMYYSYFYALCKKNYI